jgi:hypothetical protein
MSDATTTDYPKGKSTIDDVVDDTPTFSGANSRVAMISTSMIAVALTLIF